METSLPAHARAGKPKLLSGEKCYANVSASTQTRRSRRCCFFTASARPARRPQRHRLEPRHGKNRHPLCCRVL